MPSELLKEQNNTDDYDLQGAVDGYNPDHPDEVYVGVCEFCGITRMTHPSRPRNQANAWASGRQHGNYQGQR